MQLGIQKATQEGQLRLDLLTAYDDLADNINLWEERYVFKSPMKGVIDFAKFWNENQFVQSGEEIFTIVPTKNSLIGQLQLPSQGAGKVKIGQKVIIKLDDYPFEEYGSVEGLVKAISLTTNNLKLNNQSNADIYKVEVELPKGLKTNLDQNLILNSKLKVPLKSLVIRED